MGKNIFYLRVRELREASHLTQIELGKRLNIAQRTISSWERDRTEPNLDTLIALSELFSCSVDYLINPEITQKDAELQPSATFESPSALKLASYADTLPASTFDRLIAYANKLSQMSDSANRTSEE